MKEMILKLEEMIQFVESLPKDHKFDMADYRYCVIGKYLGHGEWKIVQHMIIDQVLGIKGKPERHKLICDIGQEINKHTGFKIRYFNEREMKSLKYLSDLEKDVILLYTTGQFKKYFNDERTKCIIRKQLWLLRAKKVLNKLKNI